MSKKDTVSTDFLDKLDRHFDKNSKLYLGVILLLTAFFSLLLFDVKVSTGGDDSSYIVRAHRFIKDGTFPSYQGPLYPIFLAIFVGSFGAGVVFLKMLSVIMHFGFVLLTYFTFKNRIPTSVLFLSLFCISINATLLFFASQTYNEAFYLFIQAIFFFFFMKMLDRTKESDSNIKKDYKLWILVGFSVLLLLITKNIAYGIVVLIPAYFLVKKRFKSAGFFVIALIICFLPYKLIKDAFTEQTDAQISQQGEMLLYKDPYDYSKGKEDFFGFMERYYENAHLYLSKHFAKMMGLRDAQANTTVEGLTFFLAFLLILFLILSFKSNNYMFFLTLFTGGMLSAVFIVLQTRWDQDRLILFTVPYLIMVLFYGLYALTKRKKFKSFQIITLLIPILFVFAVSGDTFAKAKENIPVLRKNMKGDKFYGYGPDWVNFLMMSEWADKNLPQDAFIASRKPTMSTIYGGGREFYGIYRIPADENNEPLKGEELLQILKDAGVTHVIMGNLRRNPNKMDGYTINTVQRYLYYIEQVKPGTFRQVHQIGTSEAAFLFEVKY